MVVRILVPIFYRSDSTDGEIVTEGCRTVGECLHVAINRFPEMKTMLFDKKGRLQTWVGVYVNERDAFPNEVARPVKDGDEVRLFLYLSV